MLLSRGGGGGKGLPYKSDGRACRTFVGVKNAVLVPALIIRLFSFKKSSVVASWYILG